MLRHITFKVLRRSSCINGVVRYSSVYDAALEEAPHSELPGHDIPMTVSRKLEFPTTDGRCRKAWIENLDSIQEKKLGLVDLHPDIFAIPPRLDLVWMNVRWQKMYRKVNLVQVNNRAEMRGGGRKPWPQKGLGKARHGSIRSPIWKNGGLAHGPRAPTSYFYMLPIHTRIYGLRSMLSIKLAQDDLHIVNALDVPTKDASYLEDLVEERLWGPSVLFIDDTDVAPENIAVATDQIKHMNIMPVYGLNVFSMLKHNTLVLTLAALERIEKQLLFAMHRTDRAKLRQKFDPNRAFHV